MSEETQTLEKPEVKATTSAKTTTSTSKTVTSTDTTSATTVDTTADSNATTESITDTPVSELESLIKRRMGNFEITISPSDLKYIKNQLNNKVEWTGPNEAYLILMSLISLSNELKGLDDRLTERTTVSLPSTTLESINFFLNRVSGKGEESAHRLFAVSMLLRPAMEQIKEIDETIEKLKSEKK